MEKSVIEQIETYAGIFLKVTLPLIMLTLGSCFINAYGDKEVRLRYIDIAVSVLNDKPSPEKQPLREWAVRTLNLYAEKKLTASARGTLKSAPLTSFPAVEEKRQNEAKNEPSDSSK
jgi:hypothetical protein